MSRLLRLEYAGALYHVTSRGNERKAIFLEACDFEFFLDVLDKVCLRFNRVIHSWCLMTNHYHLLVETPDANLSAGMRQLCCLSVRWLYDGRNCKVLWCALFDGKQGLCTMKKRPYYYLCQDRSDFKRSNRVVKNTI